MRHVQIKAIDASDFGAWVLLWKRYQRFYDVDIPEPVTRQTWERFLEPVEPMHAALAVMSDRALGLVHFIHHRSTWTTSDDCYLQDLFVEEDARGGGIGRALIEHVYEQAKRRGISRVYWQTHESNHNAMQLYDRIASRSPFVQYRKLIV
jgi:GNAT superfamily N-acetyltransferase